MRTKLGDIIKPRISIKYPLNWDPKPYLGQLGNKRWEPHENPGNPETKVFLIAEISDTQFFRHAEFYASQDYTKLVDYMFTYIIHTVYLVAEDNNEIYAIGLPLGVLGILGKLVKTNIIYIECMKAFATII